MHNFNETPNQINGNESFMVQKESYKQIEKKIHNVIFAICQITNENKIEFSDNIIELMDLYHLDSGMKNQLNTLLKPSVICRKNIYLPIVQDIVLLETAIRSVPIYALEINLCITYFPGQKIKRVKNKVKYALVMDERDFSLILNYKNAELIANQLRILGSSELKSPLQRFKELLNDL